MNLPKNPFKREPPQPVVTLDHAEILLLKEVTGFMKSKEYRGSQLEALLEGRDTSRASKASTLTPPPLADPQASRANRTTNPTRRSSRAASGAEPPFASSTYTRPSSSILEDHDSDDCETSGTESVRKGACHYSHAESHDFTNSNNQDATIYSHSLNRNVDCFNHKVTNHGLYR